MHLRIGPSQLQTDFILTIPEAFPDGRPVERLGIFLSGGLDSSILLCCLIQELKFMSMNLEIDCYTVMKSDAVTFYAHRQLKQIKQLFPNHPKIVHYNNVENDEASFKFGRIGEDAHKRITEENPNTLFYMGINRMVDSSVREFKHKLKIKYIEPWRDNLVFPFLNLAKPQIVDLYKKLNAESLIKYTHSCVMHIGGKCNNCYSCEERQWAMDELGINDSEFIYDPILNDNDYRESMKFIA